LKNVINTKQIFFQILYFITIEYSNQQKIYCLLTNTKSYDSRLSHFIISITIIEDLKVVVFTKESP